MGIIQSIEGPKGAKSWKDKFSLSLLGLGYLILTCPQILKLLFLKPSDSDWIMLLAFLVLQLVGSISWNFIASTIIYTNSHNEASPIYLYIHPIGSVCMSTTFLSFWGEILISRFCFCFCFLLVVLSQCWKWVLYECGSRTALADCDTYPLRFGHAHS